MAEFHNSLTRDFSRVPKIGQGAVWFVGGNSPTFKGFMTSGPMVFKLFRRLKKTPGCLWHTKWFSFPFAIGTVACFDSMESMQEFARSAEHMKVVRWSMVPGNLKGGFIRLLETNPLGSTFGGWVPPEDAENPDRRQLTEAMAAGSSFSGRE
ncbi:hypothetical protein [Streptomyces sp. NBC_00454]|uniref:hypothetical protein n=1 Tax=Streptomyces sp. NBC_00454 TaxID=2975747 RepID=UPI0030E3E598